MWILRNRNNLKFKIIFLDQKYYSKIRNAIWKSYKEAQKSKDRAT
jgi:hypothetical protein